MEPTESRRIALVTGAARGIGRALAECLAESGYNLVLTDRLEPELLKTAERVAHGCTVQTKTLDLCDRGASTAWAAELREAKPQIDALVLNAGVGGPDPLNDQDALAHFEHVMDVNAGATMRTARDLSPLLPRDGTGRIVIVASILGRMGVAGFSAYCASKAATIGLMRAMARDLAPDRITVNAICPGWTDTAMAQQGFEALAAERGTSVEDQRRAISDALPLGRIVQPSEVASLAAWLCGPDSGTLTGQTLTMSAGDL